MTVYIVLEEDRGIGVMVSGVYATEAQAQAMCGGHKWVAEAMFDDAAICKECADRAMEKFWHELHEEAENQYDRRVELLGPVETAEDASYRKTLYDGWSAWLLAKRIVINRHAAIEGGES